MEFTKFSMLAKMEKYFRYNPCPLFSRVIFYEAAAHVSIKNGFFFQTEDSREVIFILALS
jgi:hypothetical protein